LTDHPSSFANRRRLLLRSLGLVVILGGWFLLRDNSRDQSGTVSQAEPNQPNTVRAEKRNNRAIVVEGTFTVPRQTLFDALTQPDQLKHWMSAGGMTLSEAHVDGRVGGMFRYVFKRPDGRPIEVRGAYRTFDPPTGFTYLETYDFSPLTIDVTTTLAQVTGGTAYTQTLRYFSSKERDEDFPGVASSAQEAFARLAEYLKTRAPQQHTQRPPRSG
jgi:uncharacterized protein YndB with AHSA1/START domain